MAGDCLDSIRKSDEAVEALPQPLHPKHLLWMCNRIKEHSPDWPVSKLHRWIGFVQAGMLANRILGLPDIKKMSDKANQKHGGNEGTDYDLIDHLDVDSSFKFDIGGQG